MKVRSYHFSFQNWPMAFFGRRRLFLQRLERHHHLTLGYFLDPITAVSLPTFRQPHSPLLLFEHTHSAAVSGPCTCCFQPGMLFSQTAAHFHLSISSDFFFKVTLSQRRSSLAPASSSTPAPSCPPILHKSMHWPPPGHTLSVCCLPSFPTSGPKLHENRSTSVFFIAL